jgi:predicted RNase H-like HicB family nuclease
MYKSDEGYAVCAPEFPGCWSQGVTVEEAAENIRIAISEYLESDDQPPDSGSASPVNPKKGPTLTEGIVLHVFDEEG